MILYGAGASFASLVPLLALDLADVGETIAGDRLFWFFFSSTIAVLAGSLVGVAIRPIRATALRGLAYVAFARSDFG